MKTWIAINLNDFHSSNKKWQKGEVDTVKVSIIGAKTLDQAKETAQCFNNDAWMVFSLNSIKNIAYAK
jgi:hypothetical protein